MVNIRIRVLVLPKIGTNETYERLIVSFGFSFEHPTKVPFRIGRGLLVHVNRVCCMFYGVGGWVGRGGVENV